MNRALLSACNRLRAYIKEDEIYSSYVKGEIDKNDLSDFGKYCIQHCEDIKEVLNELASNRRKINYLIGRRNK